MKITDGKVVLLHYTLRNADGELLENSHDGEPMAYLHGTNSIVSGLENALIGHGAGEHVEVIAPPEQGYGLRQENMHQRISAKYLKHAGKLKKGMRVPVNTDDGQRWVTITKVGLKTVDVDGNHPFAGQTLHFSVEIIEVRDASAEEVSHGHAHGPGGHHHH